MARQPEGSQATANPTTSSCEPQSFIREVADQTDDRLTEERYQKAMQAYYDYRRVAYVHSGDALIWSQFSSKVMFLFVVLVITAGLYFAAFQFHADFRSSSAKAVGKSDSTEIQASVNGVKVRSSVLGVIILALSLAFLYLYLVYVYPLQVVR